MSEREILTSRQIDRPVRPLFAEGFKCETQVIAFVLSADTENDPDVAGINGASAALTISDIPFLGPIGAVRVGLVNGQFIINPTYAEMRESLLNIMVVGTADAIVMIESGAKEVKEETVVDAIEFAHTEIKKICAAINELQAKAGKPKREVTPPEFDQAYFNGLKSKIGADLTDRLDTAETSQGRELRTGPPTEERTAGRDSRRRRSKRKAKLKTYYETLRERIFREAGDQAQAPSRWPRLRSDPRHLDRSRRSAPHSRSRRLHPRRNPGPGDHHPRHQRRQAAPGSASKAKPRSASCCTTTSRRSRLEKLPSCAALDAAKSATERSPSAPFPPCFPPKRQWPYAMRVVSDILESNGSSSMATVCGAALSLMDAGVPLKAPVAGVAMGLVKEGDNYAILTDIAGAEDHYGDMDFKVAGTKDGITALQMDIKVGGITAQIMREALAQAQRGRLHILGKMDEVITTHREKVSAYAPRIYTLQIPVDKIRDVIGPGGKMIRCIIEQTGVKIDVEDSGKVNVASNDEASANRALQIIRDLTATAEVGKTYLGKVTRLADFGAFVEIIPGTEGLLHISEVAEHRIKDVRDELKEGDQVLVKVLAVEGNRIRLSRKAILKEQRAKMGGAPPPEDGDGGGSDGGEGRQERGRDDRGREERERRPAADSVVSRCTRNRRPDSRRRSRFRRRR